MADLKCEKCDQPMALADVSCVHCGEAAPPGRSARLLLQRGSEAAADGDYQTAIRFAEKALAFPMPAPDQVSLYQKKGNWHERLAGGKALSAEWREAEVCFREALSLDDGNEAVHQLWIANLAQAGRGEEALAWYEKRLQLDPADEVAMKFRSVTKLTLEYKEQDFAKDYKEAEVKTKSKIEKIFKPTTANLVGTGVMAVACAGVGAGLAALPEGDQTSPWATFADPFTWAMFSLSFAVLFIILWVARR